MHFKDRREAGQKLAELLLRKKYENPVVYGLPRGGVVVAYEVAHALSAPLDIVVTRKIGHPGNPEYAVGAVSENGTVLLNEEEAGRLDPTWLREEIARQEKEAKRRRKLYHPRAAASRGKTAIVVDDGVATGLTLLLAVRELRAAGAARLVAAVPVAPPDAAVQLRAAADELVALEVPDDYLGAVGAYYDDFPQVEDREIVELLEHVRGVIQ